MYYLLAVVSGVVAAFIAALIAVQFWRLGQHLKTRWPVVFRLYVAWWLFIALLMAIGGIIAATDSIDKQRRQPCQDRIDKANLILGQMTDENGIAASLDYKAEKDMMAECGGY